MFRFIEEISLCSVMTTPGCFSFLHTKKRPCNYHCKVCKKSGLEPNVLGKFVIMEDNIHIRCTGCNSKFTKQEASFYFDKNVIYAERNWFIRLFL